MNSLKCENTPQYKKINTKVRCQNYQSYMCKYPIQQHKHKQKISLPKSPVLYVYTPSKTTKTLKERIFTKITSLICAHTFFNNTNIKTKARFQNAQYYMCKYPLQQNKHKQKGLLPKLPVLHVYIHSLTRKNKHKGLFPKQPVRHV